MIKDIKYFQICALNQRGKKKRGKGRFFGMRGGNGEGERVI